MMTVFTSLEVGNTSTCVEKTHLIKKTPVILWKHLHVRGENFKVGDRVVHPVETPPRAWRKLANGVKDYCLIGNTSTCVEKTAMPGMEEPSMIETPPRAWRKPLPYQNPPPIGRNTSTCVEKTSRSL